MAAQAEGARILKKASEKLRMVRVKRSGEQQRSLLVPVSRGRNGTKAKIPNTKTPDSASTSSNLHGDSL